MSVRLFKAWNGPMPTTAAQLAVTTGTSIKTMLQLATPSTLDITIKAWGVSMDGAAAAAGVQWELVETGAINATVTAHVAAGLMPMNGPTALASQLTLGTAATGYTGSVEGSIVAVRTLDSIFVQPTGAYVFQWPLGDEPVVAPSKFVRIRCKAAVAVNAVCWIVWGE